MREGGAVQKGGGLRLLLAAGAALSWPLGEFERLAGPVHLSHLWIFLAFAWVVRGQLRTRRITLPFDLAASAAAALAFALIFQRGGGAYGAITLFMAFYAAASLGLSPAQTRAAMGASAGTAAFVAIASVGAMFLSVLPTAASIGGAARVMGPESLSGAVLVFLVGALILVYRFSGGGLLSHTANAIGIIPFSALFIILYRIASVESSVWLPPSGYFTPGAAPVTLAVLWVVALCAGTLLTAARLGGGLRPALLAAVILVAAGAALVLQAPVAPGAAFLLGLAVSTGYPRTGTFPVSRRHLLLPALATVLLLLAHVFWLEQFPGDARHYAARARALMEAGNPSEAEELLRGVLDVKPREAGALFWMGRAALAAGRPGEAVDYWQRAAALGAGRGVLPAPTDAEWEDAQTRLRDHVGGLADAARGWALERLLLVRGEREAALGLLRVRVEDAPDQAGKPGVYARALAGLLGFPDLAGEFSGWRTGELVRALSLGHPYSAVVTAPPGFPAACTPLVAALRTARDGVTVRVWTERASFGGDRRGVCASDLDAALWMSPKTDAEGGWHLSAPPVGRVLPEGEGRVIFEDYGEGWGCDESDGWQVICVVP